MRLDLLDCMLSNASANAMTITYSTRAFQRTVKHPDPTTLSKVAFDRVIPLMGVGSFFSADGPFLLLFYFGRVGSSARDQPIQI